MVSRTIPAVALLAGLLAADLGIVEMKDESDKCTTSPVPNAVQRHKSPLNLQKDVRFSAASVMPSRKKQFRHNPK